MLTKHTTERYATSIQAKKSYDMNNNKQRNTRLKINGKKKQKNDSFESKKTILRNWRSWELNCRRCKKTKNAKCMFRFFLLLFSFISIGFFIKHVASSCHFSISSSLFSTWVDCWHHHHRCHCYFFFFFFLLFSRYSFISMLRFTFNSISGSFDEICFCRIDD